MARRLSAIRRRHRQIKQSFAPDLSVYKKMLPGDFCTIRECRYGYMAYIAHDSYVGSSLDLYGQYAQHEVDLLSGILSSGMVAMDVGANMGALSIAMAKMVGPTGHVHALEAQPILAQLIDVTRKINKLDQVTVYNKAAGSTTENIEIQCPDYRQHRNFGALSIDNPHPMLCHTKEQVELVRIDDLELERLDFCKIDVEGMEHEVLEGASQTLARCRPVLYVENDRSEKSRALVNLLLEESYDLWLHVAPLFSKNNFRHNADNVYSKIVDGKEQPVVAINMLAIPKERNANVEGLMQIQNADTLVA